MTELSRVLESIRTSYKFPNGWKPTSLVEFKVDNGFEKVQLFQALYYALSKVEVSSRDLELINNELISIGIHPILSSTFFKYYFNRDVGSFKYKGSLNEFPQFVSKGDFNTYKGAFNAISSRNKTITKILLSAGLNVNESYSDDFEYTTEAARFDFKIAKEEASKVSRRLDKNWSNLRDIWEKEFGVSKDEYDGISGEYIKRVVFQDKITKYYDKTKSIVSKMLAQYPRNVFTDQDEYSQTALTMLTELVRNFVLSPSTWKIAYDKSSKNLKIGPSFLRGYTEPPLEMNPNKLGGILLRIKSTIFDQMRRGDNLSRHFRDKVNTVKDFVNSYIQEHGLKPSVDMIAMSLKMKPDDVKEYLRLMELKDVNFDYSVGVDARATNSITTSRSSINWEDPQVVITLIDELNMSWNIIDKLLSDQEKTVVSLYIFEELSMKEVAQILGETLKDVDTLYYDIMEKCRPHFRAKLLRGY